MKLSIELDKRTIKEGKHPIRFRLCHKDKSTYIYTDVYASVDEFTGDKYEPIRKRAYMFKERNEMVGRISRKYDEVKFALEYNGTLDNLSPMEIREYIVAKKTVSKKTVKKASAGASDFLVWFDEYTETRRTKNTIKHYKYVAGLLQKYCSSRSVSTILFDEIDYTLLCDMKAWIRSTGVGEQTRYKLESYVRAAYKEGMKHKKVGRDKYPYFDYSIEPVPERDIETLEPEVLKRLLSLDFSNQQGADGLERTRDVLMASFCLGGANLIDIYDLTPEDDNWVRFVRHKEELHTHRKTQIRIESTLEAIISRNKGTNKLFGWGEGNCKFETFQRKNNDRCARISQILGTTINLELIRRTFASVATSLEVPQYIINKLMGHCDKTTLDEFYAKADWNVCAKYNLKVQQFILEGVVPNSIFVPVPTRKSASLTASAPDYICKKNRL